MGILKNGFIRLVAVIMAVTMVTALTGCADAPEQTEPTVTLTDYIVSVTNRAGTPLSKCSVEVLSNAGETVFKGMTNSEGQVSFTAAAGASYTAVVSRVPDGYSVEEHYNLEGESASIVLAPGVMTEEDLNSTKLSLGDAMPDFTIRNADGTEYVLSELLQAKKAVVLNFWYLNCGPCKSEFPYLQEAYDLLGDDIAVLALNPYDGDDASVAAFQADNGYTFPMLKCDERWKNLMQVSLFPTTVVIDRFGNICLIETGMATETQDFLDMFGYFISDDYEQKFFKSAGYIPAYEP